MLLIVRQLSITFSVPPRHVLDYLRGLVELFDGSDDILVQESNSAHREVPSSYMIKANFKPSEVSTMSLYLSKI